MLFLQSLKQSRQNMKNPKKQYSVIVLAAGHSSRMGMPKFTLKFKENRTFLEEIIDQYNSFGCYKIVVVLNKIGLEVLQKTSIMLSNNVNLAENEHPEWERFYSIKVGFKKILNDFPVFIHNVDNPFVNHVVLGKLLSKANSDFVVPVYQNKGGHPILISKKVGKDILDESNNEIILSDFLNKFEKTRIQVNDKSILVNINTQTQYEKYFQ